MQRGSVVGERFEIEQLAGTGGMGSVFRARDLLSGSDVALKVLHDRSSSQPGQRESAPDPRFLREARVLAELSHPGIVQYVAHGVAADGRSYLAMEWLEGEDLATRLAGAGLRFKETVAMLARVADALAAAHAQGVLHRDIKPNNLYLAGGRPEGVKILDFGIAGVRAPERLTNTGLLLGTPGYMAPEQIRGDRDLDARTDLFALGSVAYECLTGRPAFAGEHAMAILAKVLVGDVPSPRDVRPDVPEPLDRLVRALLAKERDERPRDCAAVLAALAEASEQIGATEQSAPESVASVKLTVREQRLVSVLLAGDVPGERGNYETAPTLTPEQHKGTLDEVRLVVGAHGGTFEGMGEGSFVVTVSGGSAATDQAVRAARCALAIRARMPLLPVALSTGLGELHRATPVGDVVDRAVRLLRAASRDRDGHGPDAPILVDRATAKLLEARFDVEAGRGAEDAPVVLLGERTEPAPNRTLLGKRVPCVGRERELRTLDAVLAECLDEPVTRAVLVTGDPGAGKSRLLDEFLRAARARCPDLEVWVGRADPVTAGAPFAMLAEALRGALGISPSDDLELRRSRIRSQVAGVVGSDDAERVAEFLGELVGARFADEASAPLRAARSDPRLMGDQMRRAWEDFLVASCSAHPVIVVLEDLHWGDLPTVSFVDAALRNAPDLRLLVLALARPQIADAFPRLWADRHLIPLPLSDLTERSCRRLVREVLGDAIAEDAVHGIVARAGGNALYLEELIRAFADPDATSVPPTVMAMMQSRLEALPSEARRVLRAASVFGERFPAAGLAALLGRGAGDDPLPWLEVLARREVLRPVERWPPEQELEFRHGLVREAAYAMLTPDDRVVGHRLAARWLEETGAAEPVVLAAHFEKGGEPGQAIAWYRRAAEQALEGNDLTATLARIERAVGCGATGEALGQLRRLESQVHVWLLEAERGEQSARAAMELLPRGSHAWFSAASSRVMSLTHLGKLDDLLQVGAALESVWPTTGADAAIEAAASLARGCIGLGAFAAADATLARIERTIAGAPTGALAHAELLVARAVRLTADGDVAGARELHRRAAALYLEGGDLRNACHNEGAVAYTTMLLGDYAAAEEGLRESLASSLRLGLPRFAVAMEQNLGLALLRQGVLDEARQLELRSLAFYEAAQDPRMTTTSHCYLAEMDAAAGDLAAAEDHARRGLEIAGDRLPSRAEALTVLAEVLLRAGRAPEARPLAAESVAILDRLGGIDEVEARIRLVHAEAEEAAGDRDAARGAIEVAKGRLLACAAKIADDEARRSFLERVPENARTIALAAAWLDEAQPRK